MVPESLVKIEEDRPWGTLLFMAMASSISENLVTYRMGTNTSSCTQAAE